MRGGRKRGRGKEEGELEGREGGGHKSSSFWMRLRLIWF